MPLTRPLPLASLALITLVGLGAAELPAQAAPTSPDLATAASFAVLAASTVTNTGPSTISGDLGVSPGTAITGFGPGIVAAGTIHSADAVALMAQNDLTSAYNTAAGLPPTAQVTSDLAGQRLVSGVYKGPTLSLTGALTLDAAGDPNAVFVFQAASTLVTASASSVLLVNGASPCNVYWQVGSSATLGTNSSFVGSVLAQTSVTANTGATVLGRLLARTAAVSLDSNSVTRPVCTAAAVTPTAAPATSPTQSPASAVTAPTSMPVAPVPPVPASAVPTAPATSPTPGTAVTAAPFPSAVATAAASNPGPSAAAPTLPSASTPPATGIGVSGRPTGTFPGSTIARTLPAPAPAPAVRPRTATPIHVARAAVVPAAATSGQLPRTGAPLAELVRGALLLLAVGLLALAAATWRRPAPANKHRA